jgi:hypothetical protein
MSSLVPSCIITDYSIHQHILRHHGSPLDGKANVGIHGSDDVLLSKTFITADVTRIVNSCLQKDPVFTVARLDQNQHGCEFH